MQFIRFVIDCRCRYATILTLVYILYNEIVQLTTTDISLHKTNIVK